MIVCEHCDMSKSGYNVEVFFANDWDEARVWCQEQRSKNIGDKSTFHKIYAYEVVRY